MRALRWYGPGDVRVEDVPRPEAGRDEVLVSSTVKDLVVGSELTFADRGAHQLRGVPGEWRLFALAGTNGA